MNPMVELVLKHKKANMRKSECLMLEALRSAPHLNDNGLVGRIIQNGLVDRNNLVDPIGFSDISGLIDRISLVGPIIGFSGVIGLVGQISLKSALSASVSPQH